ncbi:hypothetical protein ACJ41O_013048 [Fusarium nematophilum]
MAFYEYTDLENPKGSTRLLTICADGPDDPLRGELQEVPFDEAPQYIALSYVWGNATRSQELLIGDWTFKIRPNVFDLLRRLRRTLGSFTIWIDAICINQANLDERSAQVSIMRQIYESADRTIVYLGEHDDSQQLQGLLDQLYTFTCDFLAQGHGSRTDWEFWSSSKDLTTFGLPGPSSPKWRPLVLLAAHPWFARVWAFQECLVSKQCDFILGDLVFPQKELFHVIQDLFLNHSVVTYLKEISSDEITGFVNAYQRCNLVHDTQGIASPFHERLGWRPARLIDLLRSNIGSQATDPRDFVFALLGVSHEAGEPALQPDYQEDVDQVYKRVGRFLVEQGVANIFLDATTLSPPPGWPTWIPRWNAEGSEASHTWSRTLFPKLHHRYTAALDSSSREFRCDEYTLVANGIVFDTVAKGGLPTQINAQDAERQDILRLVEVLAQIYAMLMSRDEHPYGTGRDVLRAIAHNSTVGQKPGGLGQSSDYFVEAVIGWLPVAEARVMSENAKENLPVYETALEAIQGLKRDLGALHTEKQPVVSGSVQEYYSQAAGTAWRCVPFITERGYLGQAKTVEIGDKVVLLPGFSLALGSIILYYLSVKFDRHLYDIPGPFIASFSSIWKTWDTYKGESQHTAIKAIYAVNGGFTKTAFYPIQAVRYEKKPLLNLFATRDEAYHRRIKRPIAHTYSTAALTALEPKIDQVSKLLMQKLKDFERKDQSLDLGEWLQWYAFDVIGNLTFSQTLGFIEESRDVDNVIRSIGSFFVYAAVIGQIPWLHKVLAGNPLLPIVMPAIETFNPAVNFAIKCMNMNKKGAAPDQDDFLVRFRRMAEEGVRGSVDGGAFGDADIINHTSTNVLAGSDTTAIALRSIIHNLITNPVCYNKLQHEIDEWDEAGKLSETIKESEARQMPYLQATIKEAMRMHPSVGMLLERHVPKGGATICGRFFPEGYVVGINPWVVGRNRGVYGEDADVFRPERWIEANAEQLKEMERSSLAFGAGSRVCIGKNISMMVRLSSRCAITNFVLTNMRFV